MNAEDEEWVAHALMDYERKRAISKFLSMDCKSAVPKGNNYGSDMYRLSAKVVLHSGDVVKRSFIYKSLPITEVRRKMFKESRLHTTESRIYSDVLIEMERIRQEKEPGVEPFFPVCYGIRPRNEGFLLEDLTTLGFQMVDRMKALDLHHAKIVMKSLAQFHALSLVLAERGDLVFSDFDNNYFVNHPGQIDPMIHGNIDELIKSIEQEWEGEWLIYADKLREFKKTAMTKFVEELKINKKNVNVLVHGDCWMTNMMFRYNSEGVPQNLRFLDFQITSYNNIGVDLQYFFHTSLNAEALTKKSDLIQLFYKNFESFLPLYGYSGEVPTFDEVCASYNRAHVYGVTVGLAFRPFMMQPSESVPDDLEEWVKDFSEGKAPQPPKIDFDNLQAVMKVILKDASTLGIL